MELRIYHDNTNDKFMIVSESMGKDLEEAAHDMNVDLVFVSTATSVLEAIAIGENTDVSKLAPPVEVHDNIMTVRMCQN